MTSFTKRGLPARSADPKDSVYGGVDVESFSNHPKNTLLTDRGGEDQRLAFLDYLTCNICYYPFYSDAKTDRKFWMTTCGHVVCGSHANKKGECTYCHATNINAFCLEAGLPSSIETWFSPNEDHIERHQDSSAKLTFQCKQFKKYIQYLRMELEAKKGLISSIKTELKHYAQLEASFREAEQNVNALQKENAELKSQIAFAKELSRPTKYQSPISQHHSAFVPASRLAAVPEEDMMEQDVPRARPGYATPVLTRDENGASSSKRMRTGPMGPGSAHRAYSANDKQQHPDQYLQRQQENFRSQARATPHPVPSRLTFRPNGVRPSTSMGNVSDERQGPYSGQVMRNNLDQYRFDPSVSSPLTPQRQRAPQFALHQRAASAIPARQYNLTAQPSFIQYLNKNGNPGLRFLN
ncbi:MAG: hypothetical protein TREMPRED_003821 [Tremellales sp. Tagirdzhanova-0007]|nr:MAG: hypothetical protein TREMPRED_003821 [Tremellales sp. Tagirdzhanova-0007]